MATTPFQEMLLRRLAGHGELAHLASDSGVAATVIARWRHGAHRPTPQNLWRIAPALDMPYEDLMRLCGYLPDLAVPGAHRALDPRLEIIVRRWGVLPEPVKDWLADCVARSRRKSPAGSASCL